MEFRLFASAALVAVTVGAVPAPAAAHGSMRQAENACVLKIGPDFMYFSGYQPAASHRAFCEDAPTTGTTIFALDYAQSEMREMAADLRILRDTGDDVEEASRLEALTVAYLPPRVYPNGTLNFQHDFKETGSFVGIVTVAGPNGEHWVSRFPFSVGRLYSPRAPYYLLAAAAVLGLLAILWGKEAPPKDPAR